MHPSEQTSVDPTGQDYLYDTLLRQAAERYPDRPAIIYHDVVLRYRDVVSMVNRLANGLHALGLRKGDCLCLYMSNRPEFPTTFLAAATIGLVVTPLSATSKEPELRYQLENAEARGIVLQHNLLPTLRRALTQQPFPLLRHVVVLDGDGTADDMPSTCAFTKLLEHISPQPLPAAEIRPDTLLALPYSSGTTGLPKGVMLTHRNLAINHLQFINSLGLTSSDIGLLFLPFSHIYGLMLTGSFLGCGGTQIIMEQFDLQQSLALCEQHQVTYYFAIPSILRMLSAFKRELNQLDSVRYIFCGAAPLPEALALQLQAKVKALVVQAYGLTEAAPLTHAQPRPRHLKRLTSIGVPVDQTRQKIVDIETGTRELSTGSKGEIIVHGPQVMQGYWKAPEETARVLRNGWLYTGDIGYVDEQGYTYIVDRKKDMIKYKGFSIAPAELEVILLEHPSVSETAVIGLADDTVGEYIKGLVVLHPGAQINANTLLDFANSKLAHYKQLHSIEIVEALPHTPSGKIPRRQLRERERLNHTPISTRITDNRL